MSESGGSRSEMEPEWDSSQLKMPTAPQSKISESPLFQELRETVAKETIDFAFACGGAIPIVPSLLDKAENAASEKLRATSCLPIDLRWDSKEDTILSSHTKITFPLESSTEKNLDRLIKDMTPATFGLGGEHVYDESYRKATKLEPARFSSTFNPYEVGIIDAIAQTLLPSLRHSKQTRSVKAELYMMNAGSPPSSSMIVSPLTIEYSCTLGRPASSRRMSTHRALPPSSAPWSSVSRSSTAAARWK